MNKNKKQEKKQNKILSIINKVYRFFIPKNFKDELYKGQLMGEQMKRGLMTPKVIPTWYLGKALRKLIDPKHKMKIGKKNKND